MASPIITAVGLNQAAGNDDASGGSTRRVYTMIRDHRFLEAIDFLEDKLISYPTSRAALSLLGFCHFQLQQFESASEAYERIVEFYPELEQYKLHYAQCLFKSGLTSEATKILTTFKSENHAQEVSKLKAAIRYVEDDFSGTQHVLKEVKQEDTQTQINAAIMLMRDEKYAEAVEQLERIRRLRLTNWDAQIVYNIALCYYRMHEYKECVTHCNDIIKRGIKSHPEFLVGTVTEGLGDFQTVSNTFALHKSALVEAFNLKAAMEFRMGNLTEARLALTDLPPRKEEDIDPCTLHNQAIMNMEEHPEEGFDKLQWLISTQTQAQISTQIPPETFSNLVILYMKYDLLHQAADVVAANKEIARRNLDNYLKNFFEAKLLLENDPKECYRMLESILHTEGEAMRVIQRRLREAAKNHDDNLKKKIVHEYEATLERYIPVLMAQAKLYWDKNNYKVVERILKKGMEFFDISEVWRLNDAWKLNVGHVLYMQEEYEKAIPFYEKLVKRHFEDLLSLHAVVLGNLCVCYIMETRNKDGEALMGKIEDAESKAEGYGAAQTPVFHTAIVNLVIGTLYCSRNNYKFGIDRIMKTFDSGKKKLCTATWDYAKRSILSLLETMANHQLTKGSMGVYSDKFMKELIQFLERIEFYGVEVAANGYGDFGGNLVGDVNDDGEDDEGDDDAAFQPGGSLAPSIGGHDESSKSPGKNTVTYQARLLKALFLELTTRYVDYVTEVKP